jgi:hypothetical protein
MRRIGVVHLGLRRLLTTTLVTAARDFSLLALVVGQISVAKGRQPSPSAGFTGIYLLTNRHSPRARARVPAGGSAPAG